MGDCTTNKMVVRTESDLLPNQLCGFLRESDAPGYQRLFTGPTFKRWVDIPDDDILGQQRIMSEQETFGERSVVSINNSTRLVTGEVTVAGAEADFLAGPWSSETPWEPSDEAIDRAIARPKNALWLISPYSSPAGRPCCGR
jgi:hypothetical protein